MIFDCVMFRDELDMAECRFEEMQDREVTHVVVEAPVTHRGDPKPWSFLPAYRAGRFDRWKDRILYLQPSLDAICKGAASPWDREHNQRDIARYVSDQWLPMDIVLIADIDEIPSPSFLDNIGSTLQSDLNPSGPPAVALRMKLAMYAVDWLYPEGHICSVAVRAGTLHPFISLSALRDGRYALPVVENAGWHLTWLGGLEGQRAKLGVHCHTEMTEEEADRIYSGRAYRDGEHHGGALRMVPVEVDETWPRYIAERRAPANWYREGE